MELNLITLFFLALSLVLGVFIGIGVGRRSSTANRLYNEARREADDLREQVRVAQAKFRAKVQDDT